MKTDTRKSTLICGIVSAACSLGVGIFLTFLYFKMNAVQDEGQGVAEMLFGFVRFTHLLYAVIGGLVVLFAIANVLDVRLAKKQEYGYFPLVTFLISSFAFVVTLISVFKNSSAFALPTLSITAVALVQLIYCFMRFGDRRRQVEKENGGSLNGKRAE